MQFQKFKLLNCFMLQLTSAAILSDAFLSPLCIMYIHPLCTRFVEEIQIEHGTN